MNQYKEGDIKEKIKFSFKRFKFYKQKYVYKEVLEKIEVPCSFMVREDGKAVYLSKTPFEFLSKYETIKYLKWVKI